MIIDFYTAATVALLKSTYSNNLNRADAILNRASPQDLDLLVLPELAFSGQSGGPHIFLTTTSAWRCWMSGIPPYA
jgi:predicted amidohydrolase